MTVALTARDDGLLDAVGPITLPFMAPRLQGQLAADGRLDLSLWAAGRLGSLRVRQAAGPFVVGPNRLTWPGGGLYVAQSAPTLLIRGAATGPFYAARRAVSWDRQSHPPARRQTIASVLHIELPWAVILIERRGGDTVIAAGATLDEARRGLALSSALIVAEADSYVAGCDSAPAADPVLRGMVLQGTHAALASVRRDRDGAFAGLAAGLAYSVPARTYFRDGYWTLQRLLQIRPLIVRDQIDLLAHGVQPDGEAPSGVIVSDDHQSRAWEALRAGRRRISATHRRPGEWWSDHFDSPLFFVLTISDYAAATGDTEPAHRHWPLVRAIYRRYAALADAGGGLPAKPHNDRDWADNVYREGLVAYDIGLWVGALDAIAHLGAAHDPETADAAAAQAIVARAAVDRLWRVDHYADYLRADGSAEDHLTLDSLMLVRYDAAAPDKALIVMEAVRRRLESRHNAAQPWGDWGMLCAYPPFATRSDLRSKTAFPYRYHNGADWPWLDGVYARERRRRGLDDARYPLVRWWETSLERGWAAPVEYFSPPYGRGGLLQGWSSYPAAVAAAAD
jgi:hypothetical protein